MTDPWASVIEQQVQKETDRRMKSLLTNDASKVSIPTVFGGNQTKLGEFKPTDFKTTAGATFGEPSKGFGSQTFGSRVKAEPMTGTASSERIVGEWRDLGAGNVLRHKGFGRGTFSAPVSSFPGQTPLSSGMELDGRKEASVMGRQDQNQQSEEHSPGSLIQLKKSSIVVETENSSAGPPGPSGDAPMGNGSFDEEDKAELTALSEQKATASFLNKILHNQLVKVQEHNIEVRNLQRDEKSPLFSLKAFHELDLKPELVKALTDMGYTFPSKIQEVAIPALVREPPTNMIAQSQSGTGKTAAFVLTMLNRVDPSRNHPQCLCLAPTYELAKQIGEVVQKMGKYLPECTIRYAIRGCRLKRNEVISEQIIIGTPGTSLDWIVKLKAFNPSLLKVFVLDEADVMIAQQGHREQSLRIKKHLSKNCQLLLFSATYDDDVMNFAEHGVMKDAPSVPVIITVRREEQTLDTIKQYYVECGSREDKFRAICNIYGCLTIGQSIIFCHTRKAASWLAEQMEKLGHSVSLLSGEMDITERAYVIGRFKAAKEKVLITTNVCARGIDVAQVTLVINYDLPILVEVMEDGRVMKRGADVETYLHRIGRTGRFGKEGIAVNFIESSWSMNRMREIEQYFGIKIDRLDTDCDEDMEKFEKTFDEW